MTQNYLRKTSISTAFLLVSSVICAFAQRGELPIQPTDPTIIVPPTGPVPPTANPDPTRMPYKGPDLELAKRIYQVQVARALINDPYLYKSLSDVESSPTEGMQSYEEHAFDTRRVADNDARTAPTFKIEEGANATVSQTFYDKDIAQYNLKQQRDREKSEILSDISSDSGADKFNNLTKRITELSYTDVSDLTSSDKILLGFFEKTIKSQSEMMPRSASGAEALLTSDPSVKETLARARISEKEVRQILDGTIKLEDIDDPETKKSLTNLMQQILVVTQMSNTLIENESNANTAVANEEDIKSLDEKLQDKSGKYSAEQKQGYEVLKEKLEMQASQAKVQRYEAGVRSVHDYGDAIFSVAGLISKSPDIARAQRGFNAATNITNAAGRMLFNGTLDPTGISAIAQGIGVISSLFGPQDDANSQMFAMLQEILENQRKMLAQLKRIEGKIDDINQKLDLLIAKVDDLRMLIKNGGTEAQYAAAKFAQEILDSERADTRAILDQMTVNTARNDLADLNNSYRTSERLNCLSSMSCSKRAVDYFDALRADTQSVYSAMTDNLLRPPYLKSQPITGLGRQDLLALFDEVKIEDRGGALPSAADYLNDFLKKQIAATGAKTSTLNSFPPVDKPSLDLQPPIQIFTIDYMPTFAALVTHVPPPIDYAGLLKKLYAELNHAEDATREMRKSIPLARNAFMSYAIDIASRVSAKMKLAGWEAGIPDSDILRLFDPNEPDIVSPHRKTFISVAAVQPFPYYKQQPQDTHFQYWVIPFMHMEAVQYKFMGTLEQDINPGLSTGRIDFSRNGGGIRFAGLNQEQIRSYIDGLGEPGFASLGLTLDVFKMKQRITHTIVRNPASPLSHGQVTIDSLVVPDQAALASFLKQNGQGLKEGQELLVDQLVLLGPDVAQVPPGPFDVRKKEMPIIKISPENKRPWVDLLSARVKDLQGKALGLIEAKIVEGSKDPTTDLPYQQQLTELTRTRFIVDTFVRAGLGECFYSEPDLKPLRDELLTEQRIESDLTRLENARSLEKFVELYNDALDSIVAMETAPLPDLNGYQLTSGCQLGWGDMSKAREALDRANAYNSVATSAPVPH